MKTALLIFALALSGCKLATPQIVTTRVIKTADGFTIESPKDIEATFHQSPDGTISATYKSKGNESAIKAGAEESAARAAAVARLAEAAASLK